MSHMDRFVSIVDFSGIIFCEQDKMVPILNTKQATNTKQNTRSRNTVVTCNSWKLLDVFLVTYTKSFGQWNCKYVTAIQREKNMIIKIISLTI